jgi:hypothetical protein
VGLEQSEQQNLTLAVMLETTIAHDLSRRGSLNCAARTYSTARTSAGHLCRHKFSTVRMTAGPAKAVAFDHSGLLAGGCWVKA